MRPLPSQAQMDRQRARRYSDGLLRTKDFMIDPATNLPMGKEVLQKTKIALFVDSTMKATRNMNNTMMDVNVMNMPCTSLEEMLEVTCKIRSSLHGDNSISSHTHLLQGT